MVISLISVPVMQAEREGGRGREGEGGRGRGKKGEGGGGGGRGWWREGGGERGRKGGGGGGREGERGGGREGERKGEMGEGEGRRGREGGSTLEEAGKGCLISHWQVVTYAHMYKQNVHVPVPVCRYRLHSPPPTFTCTLHHTHESTGEGSGDIWGGKLPKGTEGGTRVHYQELEVDT